MLDCGNSRTRKEKSRICNDNASVVSSVSSSRRSSRKCIETDLLCDLIDTLRYSGRGSFNDSNRHNRFSDCIDDTNRRNRILDYIDDRRNSGYRSREKVHHTCVKPETIKFDGGNSSSVFTKGPIFDFGSSEANVPDNITECSDDDSIPPGNKTRCQRR